MINVKGLVDSKVVIITGAGSGVGHAAALLFARHGAKVVCADVDAASVQATAAAVKAEGGSAIAQTCDVGDASAVDALVDVAVRTFGRLDIMYNNAGITIQPKAGTGLRRFVDATQEDIDRLYRVNVAGVMNGCKAAIRRFEEQGGGGVIVNTASVAGLIGYGGVVYGSTKGAVTTLTRALAIEVATQGIRINSVCPAGMPTNFISGGAGASDAARASMAATHPLGRPIEPMECASAALFLASDLASNITGVNLPVDGGLSAGIPMRR
jgi:NAD(P)-dependent dehydrogenase (short-subunit alcohol dehydrogenase family)